MRLRDLIVWARAQDACAEGLAWAQSHRTLKSALADPNGTAWRRWVAQHPACPADVLVRLAWDAAAGVRRGVARNPACPVDVLVRLSEDADAGVRYGVASHPAWCWVARNPNYRVTS